MLKMYYIVDSETMMNIPGNKIVTVVQDIIEIKGWYLHQWMQYNKQPDDLPYSILDNDGNCLDNEMQQMIEKRMGA